MTALLEFSFRRWSAWAPAMTDAEDWQAWAREGKPLGAGEETAPVKAMPPLLRRRAHALGRAALEVLYAPTLAYADQPMVFCSRHGEVSRSLAIQQALAAEGRVSPQEFSMSVHNAVPGLFLIARQSRAPVVALASENRLALSGMTEALTQLADGASSVILVFCDASLPALFGSFINNEPTCFAFALEMTAGKDYRLAYNETPNEAAQASEASALPADSLLSLLRFVLDESQHTLPLTAAADWRLLRAPMQQGALQGLTPETSHA
ncbi:MAG: beta-ketoacyl synthase chain length factor [Proteobacteria bacterium]|nr:beta-ketoacyl synthase chain length factor [Pseudomonadota bacterium]MCL2306860.1 beta-ketoacyl synthase chain length factor [Pseudomonadota bacterium]